MGGNEIWDEYCSGNGGVGNFVRKRQKSGGVPLEL